MTDVIIVGGMNAERSLSTGNPLDCLNPREIVVKERTNTCTGGVNALNRRPLIESFVKPLESARGRGETCSNNDCFFHVGSVAALQLEQFLNSLPRR